MKILVIVPAYNESENIEKVVNTLRNCKTKVDYLVVNDCSTDNTKDILSDIGANFINLPVNLGIGGAVQSGYLYAYENNYDIAIQIDGDGQHDPAYIGKLIQPIIDGKADMTIGSRFIDKKGFQSSALRRTGINFLSFLIKLMCGVKIYDVTSGFRATNKKLTELYAREYAQDYPEPEAIITGVMSGATVQEVPVIMKEREGGESSIKSFKSLYYMIKVSIAIIIKRITISVGGKK